MPWMAVLRNPDKTAHMSNILENPVLVDVIRHPAVESVHRGRACIVTVTGEVIEAWGDVEAAVYPRSCIKPIQALPFLESGAADAIGASPEQIALACASHSAEAVHLNELVSWLEILGLPMDALACGPHVPNDPAAAADLVRAGIKPTRLHNNCSGKHLAMLSTALHLGEEPGGYETFDHPVQKRARERISELADTDLTNQPVGTDGCNIPTVAMPLTSLARAFARFGTDPGDATARIRAAMAAHPVLIGGTERFDTKITKALGNTVVIKTGAEAVHAAAIPSLGLGIALKIDDGAGRAAEVAIAALLHYLKVIDETTWAALQPVAAPSMYNTAGKAVGQIKTSPNWLPNAG